MWEVPNSVNTTVKACFGNWLLGFWAYCSPCNDLLEWSLNNNAQLTKTTFIHMYMIARWTLKLFFMKLVHGNGTASSFTKSLRELVVAQAIIELWTIDAFCIWNLSYYRRIASASSYLEKVLKHSSEASLALSNNVLPKSPHTRNQ